MYYRVYPLPHPYPLGIIDPIAVKISVLTLISGFYELAEFNNEDRIISVTFPDLKLTPQMVFAQ